MVKAFVEQRRVITENSATARILQKKEFGNPLANGSVSLSLIEALYLLETKKLSVVDVRNKPVSFKSLLALAKKGTRDFWTSYVVYRDLRNQGYIVKTGLKFGADFRVYTPSNNTHAKWTVYPVHERQQLNWREFAAKNRVAHSVKKHLLLAVVDDDEDVSYWDVAWLPPRQ